MQTTDPTIQSPDIVSSTPVLPRQTARRRTGKVALLPAELRQYINNSLENGLTYETIAAELTAKGHPIAKNNIGSWARGGFRDYLHDKQQKEIMREETDKIIALALTLRDDSRAAFEKLSSSIVAAKIIHAIKDFDSRRLQEKLNEKPELFFRAARVVNAQSLDYSRLRKVDLEFKKHEAQTAEQRRLEEEAKREPGLSPETIIELERAMAKLM